MPLLKIIPLVVLLLCSCTTLNNQKPEPVKVNPPPTSPVRENLTYPQFLRRLSPESFERYIENLEKKYDWFKVYPQRLSELENYT